MPWVSTPEYDFVRGCFDEGFGEDHGVQVTHRRSVVFAKPRYFLVVDQVAGEGRHDLLWHFLFASLSLSCTGDGRALTSEADAANVCMHWSDTELSSEIVVDEQEYPWRGCQTCHGEDRPAASLLLRRRVELPATVAFLIEPLPPGASPGLALDSLSVAERIVCTVSDGGGSHSVMLPSGDGKEVAVLHG